MSIYLPQDTCRVLGERAERCESRSLFMDRFADPQAREGSRRDWFNRLIQKSPVTPDRSGWLRNLPRRQVVHGQLQSRLLIDVAGGVMENAGLGLDRFGLPRVPGSALKGCARRMAVQELLEADTPEAKTELLIQIAMVFGWGEADWKSGRKGKGAECHSDFWWAMATDDGDHSGDARRADLWTRVLPETVSQLCKRLKWAIPDSNDLDGAAVELPAFAGRVAFLPATPVDVNLTNLPVKVPALGELELDIVTNHHMNYYADPTRQSVALDNEAPNPVVFPAVAAGHVFAFTLAPLRSCPDGLMQTARHWLVGGLEAFGVGTKTNSGYGWFDCSPEIDHAVAAAEQQRRVALKLAEERRLEALKKKEEEAERIRLKRERDDRRKDMTPEELEDEKLDTFESGTLLQHIAKYEKLSDSEQAAIYRLLQQRNQDLWRDLWSKVESGKPKEKKRFRPVVDALFRMAKERKEKMPK